MDKTSVTVGPGFFSLLALLFIFLKLNGTIAWSWFWVLSPIIIPATIALFVIFVCLIIILLAR